MFIDLHMHEISYSSDSFLSLEEMVTIAKERGVDGICITDHDSRGLRETVAEYSRQSGFPIFVGIEFYSLRGDILAFGIEEHIDVLKGLDAIEILNGSTLPDATMKAVQYAKKWNLATTGGSDCHYPEKVGICATYFPNMMQKGEVISTSPFITISCTDLIHCES